MKNRKHQKINLKWVKAAPKQSGRKVDNSSFYNSPAWRNTRKSYLSEYPLCVQCEEGGFINPATVVDHITPIRLGGAKYDESNLQGLCATHHNIKSAKEKNDKRYNH